MKVDPWSKPPQVRMKVCEGYSDVTQLLLPAKIQLAIVLSEKMMKKKDVQAMTCVSYAHSLLVESADVIHP
eukprot:1761925-Ditylum_brightwellii.AAC.1